MKQFHHHVFVLAAIAAFLTGCHGGAGPSESRRESAPDTLVLDHPSLIIGRDGGDPESLFGDITSVVVGPNGLVYVADRIGSTVTVFDGDGSLVRTVGSEGDGPGEFRFPNDLAFNTDGHLYVRDRFHLSVFVPRSTSQIADSLVTTVALTPGSSPWSARGRIIDGRYYSPSYVFADGQRQKYHYQVYDLGGHTGDTLFVPDLPNLEFTGRGAMIRINAQIGRFLPGVNRAPFEPEASWALNRKGRIVTTPGDRNEFAEWVSPSEVRTLISLGGGPRPVPVSESRDSAQEFRRRLDSIPVPIDQVRGMSPLARAANVPAILPEILAIHADDMGNVWLRRWPAEHQSGSTVFDVTNEDGVLVRRVEFGHVLRADPPPFVSPGFVAGVVIDPKTDAEMVVVFRLQGS